MEEKFFENYVTRLTHILEKSDWSGVLKLARSIKARWASGNTVYLCGNGGSAGNAIHLANDFLYGVAKRSGGGVRVQALSANSAVITCLANDIGYESIYSEQLLVLGRPGDLLIVLSGSGNSPNIVNALCAARNLQVESHAILGFDGGECKRQADNVIHFEIDDMQISEDLQIIVGHMLMQWLSKNPVGQNDISEN